MPALIIPTSLFYFDLKFYGKTWPPFIDADFLKHICRNCKIGQSRIVSYMGKMKNSFSIACKNKIGKGKVLNFGLNSDNVMLTHAQSVVVSLRKYGGYLS